MINYHFKCVDCNLDFIGGIGELVALLETRGWSGTVNFESADFHAGGW